MDTKTVQENIENIQGFFSHVQLKLFFISLALFVVSIIVIKLLMKLIDKVLATTKFDEKIKHYISRIISIILYISASIIFASSIGINTSSLVAILSIFTLGITLAAETVLSNIAGGLIIITNRPYTIGDYIIVGDKEGTVIDIKLNYSILRSLDGVLAIIPNKELSNTSIINCTKLGKRRLESKVSVHYDTKTEDVKKAALKALSHFNYVLKDPAPSVHLTNFNASDIEFTIYAWVNSSDYVPLKLSIYEKIREEFDKAGIQFTYSHLNVHILENEGEEKE